MTNLNELQARRAQLLEELRQVEEAIAKYSDSSPVKIGTLRNLRNTPWVSVNPDEADDMLIVYADEALTIVADRTVHGGYVSQAAWSQYKMDHSEWVNDKIWEE